MLHCRRSNIFPGMDNTEKKYSLSVEQRLHESIKELPLNIADTKDNICQDKQSVTLNLVSNIMLTDNRNLSFNFRG